MNSFTSEGKSFDAEEITRKSREEVDAWFLVQQVQRGMEAAETNALRLSAHQNICFLGFTYVIELFHNLSPS